MRHPVSMHVRKAREDALHDELRVLLTEAPADLKGLLQVPAAAELRDEVALVAVNVEINERYDVFVGRKLQQLVELPKRIIASRLSRGRLDALWWQIQHLWMRQEQCSAPAADSCSHSETSMH